MRTLTVAALMAVSSPVWAGDVALLIANENYDNGRDIRAAEDLLDAIPALEAAGFEVIEGEDVTAADLRSLVGQAQAKADGSGRVIVAVSGHFAGTAIGSWVFGADADRPDLLSAGAQGVALDALMGVAAKAPGQAVLLLGTEEREFALGSGLAAGIVAPDAAQGVTVVAGSAEDIGAYLGSGLLSAGESVVGSASAFPDLELSGFLAPLIPFVGGPEAAEVVDPDASEKAFWDATKSINTEFGFEGYLNKYPEGLFVEEARAEIARIKAEPGLRAEANEKALGLTRDARREIQRSLTLLDYDPKGIDGIFGKGSRAAITKFQTVNGLEPTGFVTASMMTQLEAQAERRSAELEAEAERRRIELERQDRAYWRETGALGDEVGLRSYLERYPDGVFAEIATVRLAPFEEARRAAAAEQDRADWDAATSVDTIAAYQGYLQANPEGAFVAQANARVAELDFATKNAAALEAAKRNEERLGLSGGTRRLVEDRLMRLGLKPGPVDGVFDDKTRRSIRRYQDARKLQKTGYLNQATVVRLLADSVLR
ncbi:peptidoglycan-binding protein [uncultured Litoreibacter sp.]|uniref:peptidoglycan-binding domain-containing protein n=1 Tax=uncultured Litoreibacter sp. TaxID=1392394 RepID=UPI0026341BEB|nr:peptidoglycan-binding protein [uncultured Litoreibacter sp.]